MEEEFTGTHTQRVKQSIEELYNKGVEHIMKSMGKVSIDYFSTIRYLWCSENAVAFYNKYADPLVEAINNGVTDIITICKKVEDAHNIYANVNGSQLVSVETHPYRLLGLPNFYDNLNGVKGMNVNEVKYQTNMFKLFMNSLLSQLDDLPITIDIFDPNKDQLLTYRNMLNTVIERIRTQFDNIVTDIELAESTEADQIQLTKEYAIEVLNN